MPTVAIGEAAILQVTSRESLGHVPPRLSGNGKAYASLANAVLVGKRRHRHASIAIQPTHLTDLGICQLGLPRLLPGRHSPFSAGVQLVFSMGRGEQVAGVHASRDVAGVADIEVGRDRSDVKFVGKPVGECRPASAVRPGANTEDTISPRPGPVLCTDPEPACTGFLNMPPKPFGNGTRVRTIGSNAGGRGKVRVHGEPPIHCAIPGLFAQRRGSSYALLYNEGGVE